MLFHPWRPPATESMRWRVTNDIILPPAFLHVVPTFHHFSAFGGSVIENVFAKTTSFENVFRKEIKYTFIVFVWLFYFIVPIVKIYFIISFKKKTFIFYSCYSLWSFVNFNLFCNIPSYHLIYVVLI